MKNRDVLAIIKSYEKENLITELKMVEKFWNSEGNFNHKEMATILVSFANREGGNLIVGVKDNGDFEGKGVFEIFSDGNKSGFDKFKEYIENLCKDIISPQMLVQIQHMAIMGNDIALISVPKRKSIPHAVIAKHEGTAIRTREYYIRSNHGKALVSDRQLEWLFQYRDMPVFDTKHEIALTLLPDLSKVVKHVDAYSFDIQPAYTEKLNAYLKCIDFRLSDLADQDSSLSKYRLYHMLIGEMLSYCILQTQEGHYDKYKALPLPGDKAMLHALDKDKLSKILQSKDNLWSVPYGTSLKIKCTEQWQLIKFGNKYAISSILIKPSYIKEGLNASNPLHVSEALVTFGFDVSVQIKMKFPETEVIHFEESRAFATALSNHIHDNWDINVHFKKIPHTLILYELQMKMNQMLNELKTLQRGTY